MAMAATSDFLTQYKNISNKLKKRFLRKPNAAEPSDQFASLAAQCERFDLPQYAGLSWRAVSRCEAAQGHSNEEAVALMKAGQLYLLANKKSLFGGEEHVHAGTKCLEEAEQLLGEENPLSATVCLQTGDALKDVAPHKACAYFTRACKLLEHTPQLLLIAQGSLASVMISLGEHHDALNLFTEMVNTVSKITARPYGVYNGVLVRCEISRVLLILLLRPTPQKISSELAKLVEKYTWIGEPDPKTTSWLGEELFFLLQSLVMSCQCQDLNAVKDLEGDLWKYLNLEQRELLDSIIRDMNNSER
uniref:Factor VIII intron 22 protein n=1 Tax=Lygus hesperus TaxID=30085 RepID=A0A0A9WIH7_LYGHE